MARAGIEVRMPECDARYLADYLWEIGPTMPAGMGAGPISHSDIQHWQSNTGIALSAWEARTLRRLSIDYLNASHLARSPFSDPPWEEAKSELVRARTEASKQSIRDLAR